MFDLAPTDFGRDARRLRLDTLVLLRWLAVIGQSTAVAGVHFGMGFPLPFGACFAVISLSALLNIALRVAFPASHRLGDDAAMLLLAFDVLQLAALLYLTGGLQNPFALLFLAPVLISATALTPRRTLALGLVVMGCATLLAFVHRPLPWTPGDTMAMPFQYVAGVWTAILLGSAFTGVYAWRVAEEARQLGQALAATELVLAREQHISQLDGLAAAAAHELGTPLATIALVVKELAPRLRGAEAEVVDDMALLQDQVDRCRAILGKLTSLGHEGDPHGILDRMSLTHLVEEVVESLRGLGMPIVITRHGEGIEPSTPRNPGVIYGLTNLLDNAVDFARTQVRVEAHWTAGEVTLVIRDDGPGFASDVLLRVGEPYVTTRGAGKRAAEDDGAGGLGLGLFIAKTLIERSGAHLQFANEAAPAQGAVIRIVWPRETFERAR